MCAAEYEHRPVLIEEVMECLQPQDGNFIIDCTFGRGGYSTAILQKLGPDGRLLAVDADPAAIAHGERAFENERRLTLVHENYDRVLQTLEDLGMPEKADGIVFDLGVSSPQLDDASRGFSFQNDGPLDMRMNTGQGRNAAEWLADVSYEELLRVISTLGEERMAPRIARKIIEARSAGVIDSTKQLADIVYHAMPEKEKRTRKTHPATKTFQAIRMHINQELEHLREALRHALDVLMIDGVVAVVSFHSLEDRIVKQLFRRSVDGAVLPDKLPVKSMDMGGDYAYIAKLIKPSPREVELNPRSRSARLRAIRRVR
jgi:16S rRNA (cytosine1402-N4)-methyltransferase